MGQRQSRILRHGNHPFPVLQGEAMTTGTEMATDTRRQWYFTVMDFDEVVEYINADGHGTDPDSAKIAAFVGTNHEAAVEADRRADLWEGCNNFCAANVTYHSLGKVKL